MDKYRIIHRSPYKALFGQINYGIRSIDILEEILDNLQTEEDLLRIICSNYGYKMKFPTPS